MAESSLQKQADCVQGFWVIKMYEFDAAPERTINTAHLEKLSNDLGMHIPPEWCRYDALKYPAAETESNKRAHAGRMPYEGEGWCTGQHRI